MRIPRVLPLLGMLAACGASSSHSDTFAALRSACAANSYWDGAACKPRGDGGAKVAAAKAAVEAQDADSAKATLDEAEKNGGPLDHDTNITLWEQRGIAKAYLSDKPGASAAFDMLLALDPSHILSYQLAPKATLLFEDVRKQTKVGNSPALDINWSHGQRVGEPVPIDLEVVADPKKFLRRATVFVRTRGESGWRAADITLVKPDAHVLLPAITATKSTSLEVYARAYDDRGNEVLAWADPVRPREIPLRYDPPRPWYFRTWFLATAAGVLLGGTAITVYELTLAPPDKVGGGVSQK
jgi:hypothetical protein